VLKVAYKTESGKGSRAFAKLEITCFIALMFLSYYLLKNIMPQRLTIAVQNTCLHLPVSFNTSNPCNWKTR